MYMYTLKAEVKRSEVDKQEVHKAWNYNIKIAEVSQPDRKRMTFLRKSVLNQERETWLLIKEQVARCGSRVAQVSSAWGMSMLSCTSCKVEFASVVRVVSTIRAEHVPQEAYRRAVYSSIQQYTAIYVKLYVKAVSMSELYGGGRWRRQGWWQSGWWAVRHCECELCSLELALPGGVSASEVLCRGLCGLQGDEKVLCAHRVQTHVLQSNRRRQFCVHVYSLLTTCAVLALCSY